MKWTTGMIAVLAFAFLGLIAGVTVIVITGHDAALYVTNVGILLTAVAGFVVTIRAQQKTQADVTTVKANTNGTLTALRNQVDSLQMKLNAALALLPSNQAGTVLSQTITKADATTAVQTASGTIPDAPTVAPTVD